MPQMAWGNVTAYETDKPTIASGSGSTLTPEAEAGIFLIHFNVKFTQPPSFVATQQYSNSGNNKWDNFKSSGGDTRDNVTIIALDAMKAKVKTGGSTGQGVDRNFTFIAIGD